MITQFGNAFTGKVDAIGLAFAVAVLGAIIYMLFIKGYKEANKLEKVGAFR